MTPFLIGVAVYVVLLLWAGWPVLYRAWHQRRSTRR